MGHSLNTTFLVGFSVMAGLFLLLRLTVAISGGSARPARLLQLHRNEEGGVQSLSFVLALPVFMMVMMGIVQVSQLMIAQVVVEYAAIACARSAAVWIPAHVGAEGRNHIAGLTFREYRDHGSIFDVDAEQAPLEYQSTKRARISLAAVQACLPIAPSRKATTSTLPAAGAGIDPANSLSPLTRAFSAIANDGADIDAVPRRLRNKLEYSVAQTRVELSVFHPGGAEPPLRYYYVPQYRRLYVDMLYVDYMDAGGSPVAIPGYEDEIRGFQPNEIGWQDQITVVVRHNLALLPGPGRLLARTIHHPQNKPDSVAEAIELDEEDMYTWPLVAKATITNEGQRSVIRHEYD
ncbi:MAG: TadE family protein [Pirellulales bacterium]